jgi:hypothetical protein
LPIWLRLGGEPIAPPPKAAGAEQRNQDYADDPHPNRPANRQLCNQEKDDQQDYAADYEDGGETHRISKQ